MATDIAGKQLLERYHSVLFRLSGIVTDFVTAKGEVLTLCPKEHFTPICSIIRGSECGSKLCVASDNIYTECMKTGKSLVYRCHAGFIDIAVPLFVNRKFIGCLTAGQILNEQPTEKSYLEFRRKTSYLQRNDSDLRKLYFSAKVLTPAQIEALVELLTLAGNYIVESESRITFLESAVEKGTVSAARSFMEKSYRQSITVADVARHVYQSESYFSHRFKSETGVSPVQYLNRWRIQKAKELLESSSMRITDIAMQTGFQNLTHFNRIFRKFEGKSPTDYRKKAGMVRTKAGKV